MINYFTTDEVHVAVTILTIVTVLYECKFGEPITFVFGKPKLFEGTKILWLDYIYSSNF